MTNYEKYFGDPGKAAQSISLLVDRWDARRSGEKFSSEFTDHFEYGGDCEYGLVHTSTLHTWLEKEVSHD